MLFLENIAFPDADEEFDFRLSVKRTCYGSMYPFGTLSRRGFARIDFAPLTLLAGGNGCGKTTALNVIAEKLALRRSAPFNRSPFFEDYVKLCPCTCRPVPAQSAVIASDDVFDFMLDTRALNEGVSGRREALLDEYMQAKYAHVRLRSLDDYEQLKKTCDARRKTQSRYVRENLQGEVRERSNGENAFLYFTEKLQDGGLYLLDEPENSLSPARQRELAQFLENAVRFFSCQIVAATHSPFLLAMRGAKIYDLDADPVDVKRWTELENVRQWRDFFREHESDFKE